MGELQRWTACVGTENRPVYLSSSLTQHAVHGGESIPIRRVVRTDAQARKQEMKWGVRFL